MTAATPPSQSTKPLTAKRGASSWCIIMISVAGLMTFPEKSFTPMHVQDNPLTYAGRAVKSPKDQSAGSKPSPSSQNPETTEQKGKILIDNLWQKGTKSVHDICVVNTDTKIYVANTQANCIQYAAEAKKICTLRISSSNADTFRPLLPPLIDYWVWRRRLP